MFLEGGVEIETFQTSDEGFVDFLKRFSEELRMESHFLLTQAQKYKVTSKLLNDMEKLYNKEMKSMQRTEREE